MQTPFTPALALRRVKIFVSPLPHSFFSGGMNYEQELEQMLRLVDYVDGLMVVDKNCIIRHYYTAYPELVNLRQDEPLNRSLFEIYPTLKRRTATSAGR